MKKLLLAVCCLFMTSSAFAQWEIGIKISPSIGTNRVVFPSTINFEALNAKTHFGGGVIADYFFGENYAFSTGLIYMGKGAGVKYSMKDGSKAGSDEFGIQYLEIPVTVKLFTNDIATDTRLYFQAGGSFDPRISAKVNGDKLDAANNDKKYSSYFNFMDISALFGFGAEKQMGESTKIFGGFSYHRGLIDIDNFYEDKFSSKNIEVKNSYVALDLGLKF
jgi:hypothetical protein